MPRSTPSSIAASRSRCCTRAATAASAAPAAATGCCARPRPWPSCTTPTSSRCTTSAPSTTACSWRWSSSTAAPCGSGAARACASGARSSTCSCAGRGLAAAHAVGLVHRDFKPDNVLVGTDGRVLVMDFGLARQAGATPLSEVGASGRNPAMSSPDVALTRTGTLLGTPAYMAPEQHTGGIIGPAVDQFSFCVALYEALWGERPFSGNSVASLAIAVLEGRPRPPPRDSEVPPWLFGVLARGLTVDSSERHPSMDALLAELQRDPPKSQRPWLTIAVALGVAVGIVSVYVATRPEAAAVCAQELAALALLDDDARARIDAAFADSGREHAAISWSAAQQRLLRYDEAWRSAWTAACELELAPGAAQTDSDQRACLEAQQASTRLLVEQFLQPDADVVDAAVVATIGLDPPARCTGPVSCAPARRARAPITASPRPRPAPPSSCGWSAAEARVSGFAAPRVDVGDRAVEAELLLLAGRAEVALGREPPAVPCCAGRSWQAATTAAAGSSSSMVRAARVARRPCSALDESAATITATEAALLGVGEEPRNRRRWWVDQGHVAMALGRWRDALDRYERAAAIAEDEPLYQAALAHHRCVALAAIEARTDAIDACRNAEEQLAALLGPSHPDVARRTDRSGLGAARRRRAWAGARGPARPRSRSAPPAAGAGSRSMPARARRRGRPPSCRRGRCIRAAARSRGPGRAGATARGRGRCGPCRRSRADRPGRGPTGARARVSAARPGRRAARSAAAAGRGAGFDARCRCGKRRSPTITLISRSRTSSWPMRSLACASGPRLASTTRRPWPRGRSCCRPSIRCWPTRSPGSHAPRIELDDASAAIDPLERALELRSHEREDKLNVAETRWWLARALFVSGADEARALELATSALATAGLPAPDDPLELRRWLAGGSMPGITDAFSPASLGAAGSTPLLP
ncbi:MAG: serine/threonine-protein kinase [Nannocystaceae bacterium]